MFPELNLYTLSARNRERSTSSRRLDATKFKVRRLHNNFLTRFWGHGKNRTNCLTPISRTLLHFNFDLLGTPHGLHRASYLICYCSHVSVITASIVILHRCRLKISLRFHLFYCADMTAIQTCSYILFCFDIRVYRNLKRGLFSNFPWAALS